MKNKNTFFGVSQKFFQFAETEVKVGISNLYVVAAGWEFPPKR